MLLHFVTSFIIRLMLGLFVACAILVRGKVENQLSPLNHCIRSHYCLTQAGKVMHVIYPSAAILAILLAAHVRFPVDVNATSVIQDAIAKLVSAYGWLRWMLICNSMFFSSGVIYQVRVHILVGQSD
jgi:hypothetical protein